MPAQAEPKDSLGNKSGSGRNPEKAQKMGFLYVAPLTPEETEVLDAASLTLLFVSHARGLSRCFL